MIGIQIGERSAKAAATLAPKLQALGLFVTVCGGHTVRWLFPYRASEPELNKAWGILRQALAHE